MGEQAVIEGQLLEVLLLFEGVGALCVEMRFYVDISWESRCCNEIKV